MFGHSAITINSILGRNRFNKIILLVVQYRYLRLYSGNFYSGESDPPHNITLFCFITQSGLGFNFEQVQMICTKDDLYHSSTSYEPASGGGQPSNTFTLFLVAAAPPAGGLLVYAAD